MSTAVLTDRLGANMSVKSIALGVGGTVVQLLGFLARAATSLGSNGAVGPSAGAPPVFTKRDDYRP